MEFVHLKLGDVYPRVAGKPEGCYADHPDMFELVVNYVKPSADEIKHFRDKSPFEIRFCVINGVLFFLFKPEGETWKDVPFTPHLASNKDYDKIESGEGYALMLMLTDAPKGIIKSMRLIGLSEDFSRKLRSTVIELLNSPFDARQYYAAVNSIYARYSTQDLLKLASVGCKLGAEK